MDRLKMHSADGVQKNIEQIGQMFPDAVTEVIRDGKVEKAIDFDVLKQELSNSIVEGGEERYQFTWPDKKKSILAANVPISATLRPCVEESVGRDGTPGGFDSENLYIEGDNLEVLKLLQETYLDKVKLIYIDPPYNTGRDRIYKDNFFEDAKSYENHSGQYDDHGNRLEALVDNTESNGRFHTDWLNMIYPRLKVARNLLSDDGAIFISIDSNELENMMSVANEVFGKRNFVDCITWFKKASPSNDAKYFSNDCEYILVYAKIKAAWKPNRLPLSQEQLKYYQNPDNDSRGPWNSSTYTCNKSKSQRPNLYYAITNPNTGEKIYPKETAVWAYSEEQYKEHAKENLIYWGVDGKAHYPRFKKFLTNHQGVVTRTLWHYDEVNHTQGATLELNNLDLPYFPTPKPTKLIRKILKIASDKDSLVLDFFSGSATTADAIIQQNMEDGGHRKFIMVQVAEKYSEESEAYKAGYTSICEIGKERIRRAGKKIREENPMTTADLDVGFRVLKLDSSNMKDVYYKPEEIAQTMIGDYIDNIKEDRTPEDLLFQVMLDLAIPLSSKISKREIEGKKVYDVEDGYLIACFDENVTDETVKSIAKGKPQFAVFRDSSMADDSVATNFDQIFETYSPGTVRKVL